VSKDEIKNMLNDSEIKLTEEWQKMVYKTYIAIFGNGDSIYSQLKDFKIDVGKQLEKMSDHIGLIDMTINTYIQLDNDYKVKFAEAQQELEVERNRTQTERYWKIAIAIGAPILSILATIIVTLIITKLLP
jgi:hypothetical protein